MSYEARQVEKNIVAANLRYLLNVNHKKQVDLVNDLKLSQAIVSEYLSAKKYPAPDKMQMLADYFGVLKSDIMQEKPATIADNRLSPERQKFCDKIMELDNRQFQIVNEIVDSVLRARDG